ncbi:hypothetical protein LTR24_003571 [Lithohypha guttulata]|uniref:PhoD-like phosphatase domain-containing protein n=1 Tax=Lithohypha guttulata TaxID=1690604 RepID=A0ABR0KEA9_9EURO|nr:hypothetical protein LTR24_003571 [Lithohypha guttulata]
MPSAQQRHPQGPQENVNGISSTTADSEIEVLCGPLINYQHMGYPSGGRPIWNGTVLIVTKPTPMNPRLEYGPAGSRGETMTAEGLKLYQDPDKAFWRFSLEVPLTDGQAEWSYAIPNLRFLSDVHGKHGRRSFWVPGAEESMRIMFHSCNGFSLGTDEDYWSGPALWNDVNRIHEQRPFHVMIGGGDQIYNDGVKVNGPLKPWVNIGNPHKRRHYPFDNKMRAECDQYYYDNYVRWYSTEPFATANAAIPQVNIWDDHDIIDGFGSYTDGFMKCAVFRGIGGVSFKYYCLFQHHTAPPVSTYTTDAPETMSANHKGTASADPRQTENTYVHKRTADDPSWIVGKTPGPYVEERSRSLYMRLGKRIAFCGLDARTERTRHQVNYPETYDLIFERLEREFNAAHGAITHLIILLGVPIAYPRLAWLENILSSPLIAPLRLLHKRFGIAGGLFNQFDGGVEMLDDLDDHYTARQHKDERRELILRLQKLAQQHAIRVTIVSGDVHLAAVGRFYSNGAHDTPAENDPRYMPNIISSAITNKPPPKAVANLLARRNKIHHLRDGNTDETMLNMFNEQPGGNMKSSNANKCTMPSRNFACITEIPDTAPETMDGVTNGIADVQRANSSEVIPAGDTGREGKKRPSGDKNKGHHALHRGEAEAGTKHPAADGVTNQGTFKGGLNVSIRVEIDNTNHNGATQGYGLCIPKLEPVTNGA